MREAAALTTDEPRFTLAFRLALLSIVLTVPIVLVASWQYARVTAAMRATTVERRGVAFIVRADRILAAAAVARLARALPAADRTALAARLAVLDQGASAATAVPGARVQAREIATALGRFIAQPDARSLQSLGATIVRATNKVSDGAALSFESNVAEADDGDALSNAYPLILGRLVSAAAYAEVVANPRRAPVLDRIAIAALLAQVPVPRDELATDMAGIGAAAPGDAPALESACGGFTRAADAAGAPLLAVVYATGGNEPVAGLRPRLVAAGAACATTLASQVDALLAARIAAGRAAHRTIVAATVLAALFAALFLAGVGTAIARRDRRDLLRARDRANALDAELARQRAESRLESARAQFRAVFERAQVGIVLLDESGATLEGNAAFSGIFPQGTHRLVDADDACFAALVSGSVETCRHERSFVDADGTERWMEIEISPVAPADRGLAAAEGVAASAIAIVRDVTERKSVAERFRHAATHDALTALANRSEFVRTLEADLAHGERSGGGTVLFLDLDEFKAVNDTLGHHAGDAVLVATARRLEALASAEDLVARFHGDEFAVYLPRVVEAESAAAAAERVAVALNRAVDVGGRSVIVRPSVGVVVGVRRYRRAEDVVRDADAAMYHAKALGGGRFSVFDETLVRDRSLRSRIANDLHRGLERAEFRLAYQPIVDLATRKVVAFEALLRWDHPVLGRIPPAVFVPIAEESSAIVALGRFALATACDMLARRRDAGRVPPWLRVNVNLSAAHMGEPGFAADLERTLQATGLPGSRLTLEITETALLNDDATSARPLGDLGALGVGLCIDDFGAGYSSLRYLHQLPIDAIKIDRAFVHGDGSRLASEPIVKTLIALAKALDVRVIADGIETEGEYRALLAAGCAQGQGALIGGPLEDEAELDRTLVTAEPA